MLLDTLLLTSTTALLADFVVALAKKSPPYLIAPYIRIWKECATLHGILHNDRFSNWKPRAARYVALRAIKAQGANREIPQPALDLLESFLRRNEPVVLLGEPGAGKTTALEALTYLIARRALRYNRLIWLALLIVTFVLSLAAPIFAFGWLASLILWEPLARRFTTPVFVEARSDFQGGDVNEWCEKLVKDRLGAIPLIGSRHRVALFIDGVNEIQTVLYGGFIEGWRGRLRNRGPQKVIFTSRGGEEDPSESLTLANVLTVSDLDDYGVKEFLKVYAREKSVEERRSPDPGQFEHDFKELQKKNLLGEGSIGRNPYWLKMIVESGLYTINRGALFSGFARKLISREIKEKPKRRERSPDWQIVPIEVEMAALAALALAMHQERRIGFSEEAGWERARAVTREQILDLDYNPDDVFGEGQASTLLRIQFKKRVDFVHQLMQEFFAAYALHPKSKWKGALVHCEDVWWWQTLFHLGGLVGAEHSRDTYIELVRTVLSDGSNEQRVFAAIGLLRSVEDTPPELSSAVIGAFAELMEKNLSLVIGRTKLDLTAAQRRAIQELTRTLGEEAAEAFAMLLRDSRLEIQIIGILVLSLVGNRRAAELIITKQSASIDEFVGITPLINIGAPAVEPLIAVLHDKDIHMHKHSTEALGQIGDARAVNPLIACLRDEEMYSRAAKALGKIGADSVVPLVSALRADELYVRERAASALDLIGDQRAVEPLIAAVRDDSWFVRWRSVLALGRIRDTRAVEPLVAALRDADVRWSAAQALAEIGSPSVQPLIAALRDEGPEVRALAASTLARLGEPAVEPLIFSLGDKDESVRRSAVEALGQITDSRRVEPLINSLRNDKDPEVRRRAANVLVRMRALSVELLILAFRDKEPQVRELAVQGFREIGSLSVEPLIAALQDEYWSVRRSAAEALGEIRDERAVQPLVAALRDEDTSWSAAAALGRIGEPSIFPLIAAIELDEDILVRSRAVNALGRTRDVRAIEPLIAVLHSDPATEVRASATLALGEIGDSQGVGPLIFALRDKDWYVRKTAADALGELSDAEAIEPLIAALQIEKNVFVRRSLALALGQIGTPSVEPLIAALRDKDWYLRRHAADALGRIGDARAIEPLITSLRDADARWSAAEALERIGAAAIKPLIDALRDPNYSVRAMSAQALGKVGDERALSELERVALIDDGWVANRAEAAAREIRKRRQNALK